jgi:ABC-type antimicrobial peptide transport system permease subunit
VIYLNYMFSELRRRRGRTILTSLGLAVGIALVIAVSALSSGLDRAQATVLKPLTGVGTDMSVSRPISISGDPRTAFQNLSATERAQLRKELGGGRLDFGSLTPGTTFAQTTFRASQFSFPATEVTKIGSFTNVAAAAGGLTLSMSTISGTVPAQSQTQTRTPGGPPGGGGFGGGGRPGNANVDATTITGVDQAAPELGAVTAGQLTKGTYFSSGSAREAILNVAFAKTKNKTVGDTITIAKTKYAIVGLARTPLGGQASDVYVKLTQLQALSGRAGRVNTVYVRAKGASSVAAVSKSIKSSLQGASVTTAATLARQISGSLSSAKDLTQKLGFALELIGLLGAVLIASLLTLSSVTKRVREFGTLKALGWSRRLVVRQVAGESLFQGLLGGLFGVAIGIGAAALITLFAPTLKATVAAAAQGGGFPGPFGQGAVATTAASQNVQLVAHVSPAVIALAVALALAGGLVAGATGALRASRLRPVEALRHID